MIRRSALTFARQLRTQQTEAESLLWRQLRARRFAGYKFKRQQIIGKYVVDFVCLSARVVVEVDGGQHLDDAGDRCRDAWLERRGFAVLRFWNNDVLTRTELVLASLLQHLPSRERGVTGRA